MSSLVHLDDSRETGPPAATELALMEAAVSHASKTRCGEARQYVHRTFPEVGGFLQQPLGVAAKVTPHPTPSPQAWSAEVFLEHLPEWA